MKLKAKKKTEPRALDVCQASRCKQTEDLVSFAAGARFPIEDGEVVLCDRHRKMSEPLINNENAVMNILASESSMSSAAVIPADQTNYLPDGTMTGFERIEPRYPTTGKDEMDEARLAGEAEEAKAILTMVNEFQIVTQEDMEFANECLGDVKGKLKELKKEREGVTKPLNAALTKVRGWFKPVETFYKEAEKGWKDRIVAWTLAQAEAQRQALEVVQEAHARGDVTAVAQAMTAASEATAELPDNVTVQERWIVEITDNFAVPSDYWSPDIKKIQDAVAGGIREIPGCNIYREDIVTRRGA